MKNWVECFFSKNFDLIYQVVINPNIISCANGIHVFQCFQYKINKIFYKENNYFITKDLYENAMEYKHHSLIKFTYSFNESKDINNINIKTILENMQFQIYNKFTIIPKNVIFDNGCQFYITNSQVK